MLENRREWISTIAPTKSEDEDLADAKPSKHIVEDKWANSDYFAADWNLNEQDSNDLLNLKDRIQNIHHERNRPSYLI